MSSYCFQRKMVLTCSPTKAGKISTSGPKSRNTSMQVSLQSDGDPVAESGQCLLHLRSWDISCADRSSTGKSRLEERFRQDFQAATVSGPVFSLPPHAQHRKASRMQWSLCSPQGQEEGTGMCKLKPPKQIVGSMVRCEGTFFCFVLFLKNEKIQL